MNPFKIFVDYYKADKQILGLNYRNQVLIRKLNHSKYKKLIDNKLRTKRLLHRHKIPTPKVFLKIKTISDIESIKWEELPKSFVMKPNQGTHGKGIIVFYGKKRNKLEWIMPNKKTMTPNDIKQHLYDILAGRFSMQNKKDTAYFEERIKNHPVLKPYSYKGIPDIRVIVYKGIPLMAMLRLPTRQSGGTANLHAGGIAVGIDIASGVTTTAIHRKGFDLIGDRYDIIEETLDTPKLPIRGIKLPYWNKILELAIKAQKSSNLGYVGVDIVIDREKGPMILELNARPGLGIQMANQEGLLDRLIKVKNIRLKSIQSSIRLAKNLFGGEIEEEVENLTGKQIIGIVEKVKIFPDPEYIAELKSKRKKKRRSKRTKLPKPEIVKAKIDTGALYSSINYALALRLGFTELTDFEDIIKHPLKDKDKAKELFHELNQKLDQYKYIKSIKLVKSGNGMTVRPTIECPIEIAGVMEKFIFTVSDRSTLLYSIIIGRKDLKDFLIDPSKTFILAKKVSK